jgi:hypothetical protein
MTLLSKALDRAGFPRVDADAEARKVAVLRIVVGLLLAWRSGLIARDALYYFDPTLIMGRPWPIEAVAGWIQCALALGLALGIGARSCAVLLMLTHAAFSVWTGTYNLGPMLLVPILGALAVLEGGRLTLRAGLRAAPPAAAFRAVYLILFLAYAGWSFQAVLYHVHDPYWIQGRTTEVMFTNSYLSEFYGVFRAWERASPGTLRAMSIFVGSAQTLFQMAMIPLIFTRWGRVYVRVWGWIFILGSLFDLQLTLLPFVEAVLWAMVFMPARWFAPRSGRSISAGGSRHSEELRVAAAVYTAGYGALSLLFFTNAILGYTMSRSLPPWIANPVLFYAGLVAPNVFNTTDLMMGDRWTVLARIDQGQLKLVPFDGFEGERLAYLRSDLLYFANSLRWRREMIFAGDLAAYHQPGAPGYAYAYRVALYDHRRRGSPVPETYAVTVFRNYAAERAGAATATRYAPVQAFAFTLTIGPGSTASRWATRPDHPLPSPNHPTTGPLQPFFSGRVIPDRAGNGGVSRWSKL